MIDITDDKIIPDKKAFLLFALKAKNLTVCSQCKKPAVPHQVCKTCGYYRGRQVIKVKSKFSGKAKAKLAKTEEKK